MCGREGAPRFVVNFSKSLFGSDQRSSRGQIALEMPYGHHIWWEEPLTEVKCIPRVKDHVGVYRGQTGVKLLRNALWPSNMVGRALDRSAVH